MSDRTLTKTCPTCGVEFSYEKKRGQRSRMYCTPACRRPGTSDVSWSLRPRTGSCYYCGVAIAYPKKLYCSQLCNYRERYGYGLTKRECLGCGVPVEAANVKQTYCTRACRDTAAKYRRYGLSHKDVSAINPERACQICGAVDVGLVVDHCHATQAFRGMLCSPCNVGLGMFKDDPELMTKAIAYLRLALF